MKLEISGELELAQPVEENRDNDDSGDAFGVMDETCAAQDLFCRQHKIDGNFNDDDDAKDKDYGYRWSQSFLCFHLVVLV